jgi:hypothetical protein
MILYTSCNVFYFIIYLSKAAALGIDCDIDRDIKMCMLFADDPEHAGLREKLGVFYPLRAALRNR